MLLAFIVVDQNQIRSEDVIAEAAEQFRRDDLQFWIPDGAAFEFSKSLSRGCDQLLRTWKSSLQSIAQFSERVVVGRKLADILKEEIADGIPVTRIVDDGATELFRNLLRQINSGNESGLRELIDGSVGRLMPASLAYWSNHEMHKVMIRAFRDSLKSRLPEAKLKISGRCRIPTAWLRGCHPLTEFDSFFREFKVVERPRKSRCVWLPSQAYTEGL
jgi:hypothetical protein